MFHYILLFNYSSGDLCTFSSIFNLLNLITTCEYLFLTIDFKIVLISSRFRLKTIALIPVKLKSYSKL